MTRAGIYVRISQDRNASNVGVARQEADCRALAKSLRWTVAEVYSDNDMSAYSKKRRPEYDRLWADVAAGRIDAVLAYHPKRLYRQMVYLEDLVRLAESHGNIPIKTVAGGEVDLSTAGGRAIARIMAALAQMESEESSERITSASDARRRAGELHGGGRRPWGYQRVPGRPGLEIEPAEAEAIREAVARIITDEPLHRIAVDFAERGVPAPRKPAFIKRALVGRADQARKRERPLVLGGANWPAIITEDQYQLVHARLEARSSRTPGRAADGRGGRRYALTGLVACAECGRKMLGSGGYYRCAVLNGGCGRVSVRARDLEDALDLEVQRRRERGEARDPGAPVAAPDDTLAQREALAELAAAEAEAVELQAAVERGEVTALTGARMVDALESRRQAAASRLAAAAPAQRPSWTAVLEGSDEGSDDWRDRWVAGELTVGELEDLHAMFAAYLEGIRIKAATKRGTFEPSRIQVIWKS